MNGRINFFRKNGSEFTFRKMGMISAGLLVFFLLANLLQAYRVHASSADLAKLESTLHDLKAAEGLEDPKSGETHNPVETVLISLLAEPPWPEVMRVIPRSLPEGIWVENIQGETVGGGKMVLEGTAYQARLVPGFIDRLRSYDVFSKVNLVSSETVSKELDSPLRFKIQANPKNK